MSHSLEQIKIAKRYVGSLFAGLDTDKDIDQAAKDIVDLGNMIESSKDLQVFIRTPLLSEAEQVAGIENLATKAKLSTPVKNLLRLLAKNRRLQVLPAIVWETQQYLAEKSGIVPVSVSTARELTAADQKKIQTEIKAVVGKDILMQTHVDESLIGGLVVRVESTLIDGSIKTKLDKLERELTGGKAA